MKTKEFNPESINDILHVRAIQRRRPFTAMLELTYRCNFNCKMCYVRMTDKQAAPYGRMRTVEEWLDMARQLRDAGVVDLTLTGGECTVYPGFERLYEELAQMGFRVSVMSNAGAYTPSVRKLFEKYPPYGVFITLYGGSAETYAAVTGDPKGLEKTLDNIRFFQALGVRVGLTFTIIKDNVRDLPKVNEICRELGLSCDLFENVHPHMRDVSFSDAPNCRLTPAQRVCIEKNDPANVEKALRDAEELEKELVHFTMPPLPDPLPPPEPRYCIGSCCSCVITWNGEMTTCPDQTASTPYRPFETGFEAAWQHMQADHASRYTMAPRCQVCPMRQQCDIPCLGVNYANGRGYYDPAPQHCQYTWLTQRYQQHEAAQINVINTNCH